MISERIRRNARELKLFGLAESAVDLIDRAEQASLGYREFLDLVLEEEFGVVEGRRYASRLKLSALPDHKTLEEFDCSFQPEPNPKRLAELASLRFVEKRLSTLTLGPPGVGKTHIAVGLGMEALNAWCELHDENLSGRCPRSRVGLLPGPEGKGTDPSCST